MKNNYGEIDIMDGIAIDKSEYDSYEEAAVTAEMLSLHNVRVEEHDNKYKLMPCSEARDFSGNCRYKHGQCIYYTYEHTA